MKPIVGEHSRMMKLSSLRARVADVRLIGKVFAKFCE